MVRSHVQKISSSTSHPQTTLTLAFTLADLDVLQLQVPPSQPCDYGCFPVLSLSNDRQGLDGEWWNICPILDGYLPVPEVHYCNLYVLAKPGRRFMAKNCQRPLARSVVGKSVDYHSFWIIRAFFDARSSAPARAFQHSCAINAISKNSLMTAGAGDE